VCEQDTGPGTGPGTGLRTGEGQEDDHQKIHQVIPPALRFPLSLQYNMTFERDDMVFISVNGVQRPGQIMDIKGCKYLVELYHGGDNSMSRKKYQYWRTERDIGLFTFDQWLYNYESCPKSAFEAYREAGGYIPALRMSTTRPGRRVVL